MHNKIFTCIDCGSKLKLKHLFMLSNISKIECEHCHTINKPEKFGNWYFLAGLLPVTITVNLYLRNKDSIGEALLAGLIVGVICYALVVIYVYCTVRFQKN